MPVLGDPQIGLLDERLQGRGEGSGVHQAGAAAQKLTVRVREQHEGQHHRVFELLGQVDHFGGGVSASAA